MKKEVKIVVPNNWGGITLEKYLRLQKDIEVYGEDNNAYIACLFHHLCDFNPEYLNQLDLETFTNIKNDLVGFMNATDLPLQKFITIDGVEYGFEPNLSKIAYGAYLDIVKYDTFQIDKNWSSIMSILYRPVVKKTPIGDIYSIEDYKGIIDEDKFLGVGMDVHWGALFFFVRLLTGLPNFILNSLMESEEIPHNIKSILQKSGETIHQSYNSPTGILEQ